MFLSINRSLTFIDKFFESKIPEMNLLDEDFKAVAEINREITEYVSLLELCKLRDALRQVLAISKIGNQYFQHNKPWTLTKTEEE
jgi:methionyl-tRNA synthetase